MQNPMAENVYKLTKTVDQNYRSGEDAELALLEYITAPLIQCLITNRVAKLSRIRGPVSIENRTVQEHNEIQIKRQRIMNQQVQHYNKCARNTKITSVCAIQTKHKMNSRRHC